MKKSVFITFLLRDDELGHAKFHESTVQVLKDMWPLRASYKNFHESKVSDLDHRHSSRGCTRISAVKRDCTHILAMGGMGACLMSALNMCIENNKAIKAKYLIEGKSAPYHMLNYWLAIYTMTTILLI